jgi:hypothetical protein
VGRRLHPRRGDRAIREVGGGADLKVLPKNEASVTLVGRMFETIDAILSDLASLPANLRQAAQVLEATVSAIEGSTLTHQERENILAARAALENLCEMPDGFDGRIRGVLHYRKEIARLAQAEADRAIAASELPEAELTQEQRTALARQAAARR